MSTLVVRFGDLKCEQSIIMKLLDTLSKKGKITVYDPETTEPSTEITEVITLNAYLPTKFSNFPCTSFRNSMNGIPIFSLTNTAQFLRYVLMNNIVSPADLDLQIGEAETKIQPGQFCKVNNSDALMVAENQVIIFPTDWVSEATGKK